jgi:integrase
MPRLPKPRVWRDKYVTNAGTEGRKIHVLCDVADGRKKAEEELKKWLDECDRRRIKAEVMAEAGLATLKTDGPYTVAQMAAEFMELKNATKPAKTVEYYRKNLGRLVEWYGALDAAALKPAHAAEFINRMKQEELGNCTINHHVKCAKAALRYAEENGRVARSPWRRVKNLPEWGRRRIATEEEFNRLLAACDRCNAYQGKISAEDNAETMRDTLYLLRYTALRPGEFRKLRWDHLHLSEGLIIIPAREQKTGTTARNPEDRWIPILDEVRPILERRQAKYGYQPLVFTNAVGKPWKDTDFSNRFRRLRTRAGLDEPDQNGEKLVPYSLRHTRLTEAGVVEGQEFYTVMRLAGHTTPQMTRRYVHPGKNDLLRAAREGAARRKAQATPS